MEYRAYPRMNKKLKAKWLKALKSGKYKFGRNSYQTTTLEGPAYCAIGVLVHAVGLDPNHSVRFMYDNRFKTSCTVATENEKGTPKVFFDSNLWHKITALNDYSTSYTPAIKFIEEHL